VKPDVCKKNEPTPKGLNVGVLYLTKSGNAITKVYQINLKTWPSKNEKLTMKNDK
jgi:hypothetical protein